jgi:hypothetical protein
MATIPSCCPIMAMTALAALPRFAAVNDPRFL